MKNMERRTFDVSEMRAITNGDGLRKIVGYAAVFNSLSEEMCGFREKIAPGAFGKSVLADDIRALWNHNSDHVLGRNKSGTLALSEDDRGLKIEVDPPDTQWARDLMVSIDRGDVDKMSFGFRTITDKWEMVGGQEIRTLIEVKLFDVSPVTFPAYPDTQVALRSLEQHRKDQSADPSTGGTDAGPDPSIMLAHIAEEDDIYKQINGIQEETK